MVRKKYIQKISYMYQKDTYTIYRLYNLAIMAGAIYSYLRKRKLINLTRVLYFV